MIHLLKLRTSSQTEVVDADEEEADVEEPLENEDDCLSTGRRQLEKGPSLPTEMLSWNIATSSSRYCARNNLLLGNAEWLEWYAEQNNEHFLQDVTSSDGPIQYSAPWKCFMVMECRGQLYDFLL